MKNTFILLFFLTSNISLAQFQIESNFNSVAVGRNQSLLFNYTFNKLQVGVGFKYNFNKLKDFPQGVLIKKTFYATKPVEHWGLELNLKCRLLNIQDVLIAHFFFNSQFTKSHTRFEAYFAVGQLVEEPTSEFDYLFIKHNSFIGPFLAFENNIGLAFEMFLNNSFYLSQKFGLGLLLYKSLDKNTNLVGAGNWVFSEMLSFGIGYRFKKKKKTQSKN